MVSFDNLPLICMHLTQLPWQQWLPYDQIHGLHHPKCITNGDHKVFSIWSIKGGWIPSQPINMSQASKSFSYNNLNNPECLSNFRILLIHWMLATLTWQSSFCFLFFFPSLFPSWLFFFLILTLKHNYPFLVSYSSRWKGDKFNMDFATYVERSRPFISLTNILHVSSGKLCLHFKSSRRGYKSNIQMYTRREIKKEPEVEGTSKRVLSSSTIPACSQNWELDSLLTSTTAPSSDLSTTIFMLQEGKSSEY